MKWNRIVVKRITEYQIVRIGASFQLHENSGIQVARLDAGGRVQPHLAISYLGDGGVDFSYKDAGFRKSALNIARKGVGTPADYKSAKTGITLEKRLQHRSMGAFIVIEKVGRVVDIAISMNHPIKHHRAHDG